MVQMSKNTEHPLISKILVAVDGSETSSKAAEMAIDLQKSMEQILFRSILLHLT